MRKESYKEEVKLTKYQSSTSQPKGNIKAKKANWANWQLGSHLTMVLY